MKNLLNLTESEKSRILNLHKSAIKKEFLFEQRMDAEGKNVEMYNNDKDYDYKKEGDKYFFKLKATPKSEKAKALLAQKKFINWIEAKPGPGLDAIKTLPFQAVAPPPPNTDGSDETFEPPVQTTNTTTTPTTTGPDAVTGNQGTEVTGAVTPNTSLSNTQTQTTPTTAPTSQNPEIAADLKTASQIRQEFRQGKRDKNKATRQYNQMVNKYNRLKSKMSPQDNAAYLQAMNQLKQQIG